MLDSATCAVCFLLCCCAVGGVGVLPEADECRDLIPVGCVGDHAVHLGALQWVGQQVAGDSEPLGALTDVCPVVCHHEGMEVTLHLMHAADGLFGHGDAGHVIHCEDLKQLEVIRARGLVLQCSLHGACLSLIGQTDLDLHHASRVFKVLATSSDDVDAAWFVCSLVSLGHESEVGWLVADVLIIGDGGQTHLSPGTVPQPSRW